MKEKLESILKWKKKKEKQYQNMQDVVITVHRDKYTVVTTYIRKKKVLNSMTSTSTLKNFKKKSKLYQRIKVK